MSDFQVDDRTVTHDGVTVPIRDYRPVAERSNAKPFLWVHGGAFSFGKTTHRESDAPARALATGRRVVTVDYRLAPASGLLSRRAPGPHPNRFPAARDDVVEVARWLAKDSGSALHIGGASAGANLAAAAVVRLRGDGEVAVASTVLVYGLFHAALPPAPDVEASLDFLSKPLFGPRMLHRITRNYLGEDELLRPGPAFPAGTDLSGFPPALMLDAELDRLRASGQAMQRDLREAGVEVEYAVVEGARHGFLSSTRGRSFRSSMPRMASWLDRHD